MACLLPSATGGAYEGILNPWRGSSSGAVGGVWRDAFATEWTPDAALPAFENEDVKVWKSVVMPNAPLSMHRHDHPRVIIALSGGTMKIVEQNGAPEQHVWETGKAYWLPANPPNTLHADVNGDDKPIEAMVVELKHEK